MSNSNNNNQISQSENRWQPKVSNPDIQNLYQKIQEAARDRDWMKIKENNQLRKGFKINQERYVKLKELLEIIERPKVEDQWITKPITLRELSESIEEESEIPKIEENVTTEEIKEIIETTINYKELEE